MSFGTLHQQDNTYRHRPYFALTSVLKNERPGNKKSQQIHTGFLGKVRGYHEKIDANRRKFFGVPQGGPEDPAPQYEDYLYQVCSHQAFTFGDHVEMLLVDDIDPYFHLTSQLDLPIHQISLGFCPELESLGIPGFGQSIQPESWLGKACGLSEPHASPFLHLDDLIQPVVDPSPVDESEEAGRRIHQFQCANPLLVFTRLKLAGLSILGNGLLQRRAIHRAIAKKVVDIQQAIINGEAASERVTASQAKALQVSIIDAQGTEEIALYIPCQNYSLGVLVAQAVASLTYQDLFKLGADLLWENISGWRLHERFRLQEHEKIEKNAPLIANHVFAASYTILGATQNAHQRSPEKIGGCLEVFGRVNVLAGHFVDIADELPEFVKRGKGDAGSFKSVTINRDEELRYLIGRYDYDYSLANEDSSASEAVETVGFLEISSLLRRRLQSSDGNVEQLKRAVIGWSNDLVVPVSKFPNSDILPKVMTEYYERQAPEHHDEPHYDILETLETNVQELFTSGELNDDKLRDALEQKRLPMRVRRTGYHLIKNFRDALLDPQLYASVIDLLHPFIACHTFLTEDLQQYFELIQSRFASGDPNAVNYATRAMFDEKFISRLSLLFNAMHNAHSHRVHRYTKHEFQDQSIDFRGGLTQLVHGSNAPLICSVGLLKRCWSHDFFSSSVQRDYPGRVGIVQNLSLNQQWQFFKIKPICKTTLPSQKSALGIIEFSFGHVLNPLEYIDLLHEAAHLLIDTWDVELPPEAMRSTRLEVAQRNAIASVISTAGNNREARESGTAESLTKMFTEAAPDSKFIAEAREEYFADLVTNLFFFGNDIETARTYAFYKFNAYPCKEPNGRLSVDDQRLVDYLDYAFRVYAVTTMIEKYHDQPDPRQWGLDENFQLNLVGRTTNSADQSSFFQVQGYKRENFFRFLRKYQHLDSWFHDWDWSNNPKNIAIFDGLIVPRIIGSKIFLGEIWKKALILFRGHCLQDCSIFNPDDSADIKPLFPWYDSNCNFVFPEVRDKFRQSLEAGECMIEEILSEYRDYLSHDEPPDLLGLVCAGLSAFASLQLRDLNELVHEHANEDAAVDCHLKRNEKGEVTFRENQQYSPFLIEPLHGRLFSCSPEHRSERCKWEISIHRVLSEISSRIRGRRLRELMPL